MTGDFLRIDDVAPATVERIVAEAARSKRRHAEGRDRPELERRTLGMLFEQPSTRTRVSLEAGMTQLGGHAVFMGPGQTQLSRGEPIADTARTLSRYVDGIAARVERHEDLRELAAHASVPVVNALSDLAHPCQTLADLLTLREYEGADDPTVAWIGDGNNVARSFVVGCAMAGIECAVATPSGYDLEETVLERAENAGRGPTIVGGPEPAVADADVVYTDVWASMTHDDERARRRSDFAGYRLDEELLGGTDAAVMHPLPAHRGEEITDEVLESDRSLVFEQAENRLHTAKAVLSHLLDGPLVTHGEDPPTLADGSG